MKTVLFLTFDFPGTIRRFLLIADYLKKLGVQSHFVSLDSHELEKSMLREMDYLELEMELSLTPFKEIIDLKQVATDEVLPKSNSLFNPGTVCQSGSLQDVENSLKLNPDKLFSKYLSQQKKIFATYLQKAQEIFAKVKPTAVVSDYEEYHFSCACFHQAELLNVPTFSIQHGIGYAEQYSLFPMLEKYYFSFSDYNSKTLRRMGIPDSNIFQTGAPDPDFKVKTSSNLREKLNLQTGDYVVLIALKACGSPNYNAYRLDNIQLLEDLKLNFGSDSIKFLVRRHPADFNSNDPELEDKFTSSNMQFVDHRIPIEELMLISDYCVMFRSTCILECVSLQLPFTMIESSLDDGNKWPNWEKHPFFELCDLNHTTDLFQKLKRQEKSRIHPESSLAFTKEFQPSIGRENASKIAQKITALMRNPINAG